MVLHTFTKKIFLKKLKKLPRASKEVFNLFAIEGYSHQEIAEKLGISEGTSSGIYPTQDKF